MNNVVYLTDCMDYMRTVADKAFDLAIVDPPYGDGNGGVGDHEQRNCRVNHKVGRTGGKWASKYGKDINQWDIAPSPEYFKELFRISKHAIIWGGGTISSCRHQGTSLCGKK